MKLTCLQENLNECLNIVARIAGQAKSSLPILSNVLLTAEDSNLKISATNLEMAIEIEIRAKIEKKGRFTVSAALLNNYINSLKPENINLEVQNNELLIQTEKQKAKIKGLPADEFPIIPEIEKKEKIVLQVSELKKGLKQTIFSVVANETRRELSGLYCFPTKNKILTLVGTDSYRLAEKKISIQTIDYSGRSFIIPRRALDELLKMLEEKGQEEITLYPSENQLLFVYKNINFITQLINSEFPNYQDIIPKNYKTRVIFDKDSLVRLIKTASFFTKTGINDLSLKVVPQAGKIQIQSLNSQVGENEAEMQAEIEGEANEVVFNYQYLLDGLMNLPGHELCLDLIDNNLPGILRNNEDHSFLYLIMPIKAN